MRKLKGLLATWFGSGYSPFASGTAGTLATMPLVALLWWAGSWPLHLAALVAVVALGLWAADDAETRFEIKDPGQVVIDETAGYLLTTFLVAPVASVAAWGALLALTFLLFRIMDILKPWPARRLEALPGALGIMIDDLFAGLYAFLLTHGLLRLWSLAGGAPLTGGVR